MRERMSQPLPQARAAIFDLDGTLLDTLGDLADSVNVALEENGHPVHREEVICGFIGDGAESLMRRALPQGVAGEAGAVAACLESFKAHYAGNYANRTRPYPGIIETLEELGRRGIPLGILSNKPHAFTVECARAFFGEPGERFGVVFGQREGVPKKPDPAGAVEVARGLGTAPSECLYVGDSAVDMQTAISAGMIPVGVAWGFRSPAELRDAGAREVIDDASQLLTAFSRQGAED